jgi:anti-sigma factor RsiW
MDHLQAVNTLAMERYLLEEMPQPERDSFEEHYFSCVECAEDARTAAAMRDGAASGLARAEAATTTSRDRAVLPFRQASPRGWRSSVALPWAAAALLAIGVGYQSVAGPLVSRHAGDSFPLTPSTLRPASRGQEAVVSPGPGAIVTLAVDLGGAEFGQGIKYELARADGKTIASGEAPAPVPGAALLLMFPGSVLKGSEHFVLTLNSTGSPSLTPATYRFRVMAP